MLRKAETVGFLDIEERIGELDMRYGGDASIAFAFTLFIPCKYVCGAIDTGWDTSNGGIFGHSFSTQRSWVCTPSKVSL